MRVDPSCPHLTGSDRSIATHVIIPEHFNLNKPQRPGRGRYVDRSRVRKCPELSALGKIA